MVQSSTRICRESVVHPGTAPIARHQTGLAQDAQVMRDGWLIQRESVGKVADADFILCSGQGRQHRETVRVRDRLEKSGSGLKVGLYDLRWGAASLHRHCSMLAVRIHICQCSKVQS